MIKFICIVLIVLGSLPSLSQVVRKDVVGNLEVFDAQGRLLEYHYLYDGENFRQGNNIAKRIYTYDSVGFLLAEKYYRANGRPYQFPSGIAMIKYTWNRNRDVLVKENLDSIGTRVVDEKNGASLVSYRYDSLRKVKEVAYFDKDSVRVNNRDNYSRVEFFNTPTRVEKYYDSKEKPVLILNDTIKFLRGLQLQSSSIPKWLRKVKQKNMVDGIAIKSFAYSFVLTNQDFDGDIQMSALLVGGDIKDVKVLEVVNASKRLVDKIKRSFSHAHFIALTRGNIKTIEGVISVYFVSSSNYPPW